VLSGVASRCLSGEEVDGFVKKEKFKGYLDDG
jgi:hypothetical protein